MDVKWLVIENIVTILLTAAVVLGLYWMGAGGWSFLGLLFLINLNSPPAQEDEPAPKG